MITVETGQLVRLTRALKEYVAASGKSLAWCLAKQSRDLAWDVAKAGMKYTASFYSIDKLNPKDRYALTISPAAKRIAARYMGGEKAIWAFNTRQTSNPQESVDIRSLRVGRRGKRITGGRRGRGGRAAGYAEGKSMLAGDSRFRVWNRRAVETFFEWVLRRSGRRSLWVSWMLLGRRMPKPPATFTGNYPARNQTAVAGGRGGEPRITGGSSLNAAKLDASVLLRYEGPEIGRRAMVSDMVTEGISKRIDDMIAYISTHSATRCLDAIRSARVGARVT